MSLPPEIIQQTEWFNAASQHLQQGTVALQAVDADRLAEADEEDGLHGLQLLLQYRLDCQDALKQLFQIQQSLWQILGLSPNLPGWVNMERLEYALGSDDLHLALSMLNQLAEALLRLIQRKIRAQKHRQQLQTSSRSEAPVEKPVKEELAKIKRADQHIKALNKHLMAIAGSLAGMKNAPCTAQTLDHITKLQGPVNEYYLAIQHGLVFAGGLQQRVNHRLAVDRGLQAVLHKANQALEASLPQQTPARLFTPVKDISAQDLQERAATKRMGHWF